MKKMIAAALAAVTAASMCSAAMAASPQATTVTVGASEVTGASFKTKESVVTIGESDAVSFSLGTTLTFAGISGSDTTTYTVDAVPDDADVVDILSITPSPRATSIKANGNSGEIGLLVLCGVTRPADGKNATATVTVTATKSGEVTADASTTFTIMIVQEDSGGTPSIPLTSVTLAGMEKVGETLTAKVTPSGAAATYQWFRSADANGAFAPIPNAAGSTYRLTDSDRDQYVKVEVTGAAPYSGTKAAVTGKIAAGASVDPNRAPSVSGGGSFDPDYKDDVSFMLDPGAGGNAINVARLQIKKGGATLGKGTDYAINQLSNELYELVIRQSYLSTLSAGEAKFVVTAPYSNGPDGRFFKETLIIRVGRRSSDDSGDKKTTYSASDTAASKTNKVSYNVSSTTGVVKESAAVRDVINAVKNTPGDGVSVTVRNAKAIEASTLEKMARAAGDKKVILRVDKTADNGAVLARLYIDVKEAAKAGKRMNLDVAVGDKFVSDRFAKFFVNDVEVVSFAQNGSFGMDLGVAVKADLTKLDGKNLKFYSFSLEANRYREIDVAYSIDKNGYLRMTVDTGGCIVITDREFEHK